MWHNIKGEIKHNYNLSHLTWFKVGGEADFFFKPSSIEDLANFLKQNTQNLPIFILGAGSNVIIRDKGFKGIVIKLGKNFTNIEYTTQGYLSVGAGCLNYNLSQFCLSNSIEGLEFLSGIPGTIGGGVAMNAGSYGSEFKDIVLAIEVIDTEGKIYQIQANEIGFKHRATNLPKDLIVTKAIFNTNSGSQILIKNKMDEIKEKRQLTQPINTRTGGSTFVNPESKKAWKLIDEAGCRGVRIGDAGISELHCNFMINYGSATAKDLETLGEEVKNKVFLNSGIMLNWEIKRIGEI